MFEDRQGTFWFCTLDDGIYGLPHNTPISYYKKDGLLSENLSAVIRDDKGRILFGDDEGNLNILQDGKHTIHQLESIDGYNRILSILPIAPDYYYVLTDEAVFAVTASGETTPLGFGGSPKVLLKQDNLIWCGTSARLFTLDLKTQQIQERFEQRITALGTDSENLIWAGGIDGLYTSADGFKKNWGHTFPSLKSRIIAIQNGGANTLWVATPEADLLKVKVAGGQVISVQPANDFLPKPVHNIHAIFRENSGQLWLSTNQGVIGVNPTTWDLIKYNHNDGLANDDVRAIYVYQDTLWAATTTGLTRMLLNTDASIAGFSTLITGIRYQQNDTIQQIHLPTETGENRTTTLPGEASLVEVDFAGLNYRSRGNLWFDCLITEVLPPLQWLTTDNLLTWIGSGFKGKTDTARIYKSSLDFGVHMPPGKYKLQVTACTQNGIRSPLPGEWAVVMPTPWFKTFWFWLGIWMLTGYGVYRFFRTQLKLRDMNALVAQLRLIALQAQINPHFIGNSINAIQRFFYPPSPTRASIYNATFTQLLRKTLDYSEQTFIPFSEEVAYHKDYLELAQLRYGDTHFEYTISGADTIPGDLAFPALFLQPILENATIHGNATDSISSISIAYHQDGDYIYCTITDNGPGIHAKQHDQNRGVGKKHRSKGIRMLQNKAAVLNQLFDLDLQLSVCDLQKTDPLSTGTKVTVSFNTSRINHALARQKILDKQQKSVIKEYNKHA
ncbi:MAG: hypothetical protein EP344_00370 [Bacteroidetes bacterium]|nr:MAG: hypothetical protein EP344_00370 [Bacteroidota bacterium]